MVSISVIIPVYNVKPYLSKCIESILHQSFNNIEILLINDGSIDGSDQICESYQQKDKRIKVYHQKNQGVTKARARGIQEATGEFLCFVDSDDYLPKDALLNLWNKSQETGAEIVCGDYEAVTPAGKVLGYQKRGNYSVVTRDTFMEIMLDNSIVSLWDKLISRSLFTAGIFEVNKKIRRGEDFLLFLQLVATANKIAKVNRSVYCYVQRQDSVMHTTTQLPIEGRIEFVRMLNLLNSRLPLSDLIHQILDAKILVAMNTIMMQYNKQLYDLGDLGDLYKELFQRNKSFILRRYPELYLNSLLTSDYKFLANIVTLAFQKGRALRYRLKLS